MELSNQFIIRLKFHKKPAYRLAQEVGVNPNTLSKLVNGIEKVRPSDPRVIAIGALLGLSRTECFESENQENCHEQSCP